MDEIRTNNFPAFERENAVLFALYSIESLFFGLAWKWSLHRVLRIAKHFLAWPSYQSTLLWRNSTTIDGRILQLRLAVHPTYWVFYIPLTAGGCLSSRVEKTRKNGQKQKMSAKKCTESFWSVPSNWAVNNLRSHSMKPMENTMVHRGFWKCVFNRVVCHPPEESNKWPLKNPLQFISINLKPLKGFWNQPEVCPPCKMKIIFKSARWDGIC